MFYLKPEKMNTKIYFLKPQLSQRTTGLFRSRKVHLENLLYMYKYIEWLIWGKPQKCAHMHGYQGSIYSVTEHDNKVKSYWKTDCEVTQDPWTQEKSDIK